MEFYKICIILYVFVTVFALIMTRREQRQTGQTSILFNSIGFAVCTVWPVAMISLLAARALRLA